MAVEIEAKMKLEDGREMTAALRRRGAVDGRQLPGGRWLNIP
jgi:hypothetical protein